MTWPYLLLALAGAVAFGGFFAIEDATARARANDNEGPNS